MEFPTADVEKTQGAISERELRRLKQQMDCEKQQMDRQCNGGDAYIETARPMNSEEIVAEFFGATIIPAHEGYLPFTVDGVFLAKHNPEPGGYFVQYADGYKSFSPAQAFEEGYTRIA